MKKFFLLALVFMMLVCTACGNEKSAEQPAPAEPKIEQPAKPQIKTITYSEATEKLKQLSSTLDVHFDDMKEIMMCRCNLDIEIHPHIWIIPYVVVDKNFNVALCQYILYLGNEPLYFKKLYVKTSSGVETFRYNDVIKGSAGEEYDGILQDALYEKLKEAVNTGQAKFRLEGRTFGERELTQKELSDMATVFALYEFFKNVKIEN